MTDLAELQQRLGYQFKDNSFLVRALTHRSVGKQHNERYEFLGDSLLGFLVADFLYTRYPDASEGELTRSRATMVNKPALAALARRWQLGNVLRLGSGERKSGGAERDSILADAVEAIIAAVYLDSGLLATQGWLAQWLENAEAEPAIAAISDKDSKTQLQEWLQARALSLPSYSIDEVSGPPHKQQFAVSCRVNLGTEETPELVLQGHGNSKRAAEQDAATQILAVIRNE